MSVESRQTKDGKTRYVARATSGDTYLGSRTFARKKDAEAWERDQKHRFETGKALPPKRSFTLRELVEQFREARQDGNPHTVDTDNNNLTALPDALLNRPLSSVHADDIRDHLRAQLRAGKAPATVARAKTTLSALFTYADEQGMLTQPHPARTMKKIAELSTVGQRAVTLGEIPTAERIVSTLRDLRERRSDIADVFEFMALTGMRWGEVRAIRASWFTELPLPQLNVERSHSDRYDEKGPKSWRGTRSIPLSPRGVQIIRAHANGKSPSDYLFTNRLGGQLTVNLARKFPLGFRRHALRHFAASAWLRLGTPVHEVAEYLGDDPRTVLKVYAHVLGEGQRRDFAQRLAAAETTVLTPQRAPDQSQAGTRRNTRQRRGDDIGIAR